MPAEVHPPETRGLRSLPFRPRELRHPCARVDGGRDTPGRLTGGACSSPFDNAGTLNVRLADKILSVTVPRVAGDHVNPTVIATSGSARFTFWATTIPCTFGTIRGTSVAKHLPLEKVLNARFACTNVQSGDALNNTGGPIQHRHRV
jgi:hypothetical protein